MSCDVIKTMNDDVTVILLIFNIFFKMALLSHIIRAYIIQYFFENGRSVVSTIRKIKREHQITLNRSSVKYVLKKFLKQRKFEDQHRGNSGRPKSATSEENIRRVQNAIESDPRKSARRLSAQLNMKKSSVHNILRQNLKLFPYKIQVLQTQTEQNKRDRVAFCRRYLQMVQRDPALPHKLHFSDEAWFHLSGHVNKQNMRFWSATPVAQGEFEKKPLSPVKVMVWCALGHNAVIGPYFFEEDGHNVSVNSKRYIDMINHYYWPALKRRQTIDEKQLWFQQDGATPHTAQASIDCLRRKFGERLISRRTDFVWPAYSPDLNPCDFFLWGHLKAHVYSDPVPENIEQLKLNIRREIRRLQPLMLTKVTDSVSDRARDVIRTRGGWIEGIVR